jgi:uncharacterized protein YjbI with pentapeptide repeats
VAADLQRGRGTGGAWFVKVQRVVEISLKVQEMSQMWGLQRPSSRAQRSPGLSQPVIIGLVIFVIVITVATTFVAQFLAERGALTNQAVSKNLNAARQLDKLNAQILQIRSETAGSLFWLKMVALFITVGSAVGGYLIAHTRSTNLRLRFEKRNEVLRLYEGIVDDLAADKPVLRAAAAVKLGAVLEKYPSTWAVEGERSTETKQELVDLTKQVLASSLTIEPERAVLKVLTISLARHRVSDELGRRFDMRKLDLSGAKAADAYWADCDLTGTDLYNADLTGASLRRSTLEYAQFRNASLVDAVLSDANLTNANFKEANLRNADLSGVKGWNKITDIKDANVFDVRNAPYGFEEWAMSRGALAVASDMKWKTALLRSSTPSLGESSFASLRRMARIKR